jgi:hypothetical protein
MNQRAPAEGEYAPRMAPSLTSSVVSPVIGQSEDKLDIVGPRRFDDSIELLETVGSVVDAEESECHQDD